MAVTVTSDCYYYTGNMAVTQSLVKSYCYYYTGNMAVTQSLVNSDCYYYTGNTTVKQRPMIAIIILATQQEHNDQ